MTNYDYTLYIVRHGKTFFNTTEQVQGFSDSPLTNLGVEQAKRVGKKLGDIRFDLAYSSDLARQRNTLKIIISQNKNREKILVKEHTGFREWNYGGFEGKSYDKLWKPLMENNGLEYKDELSNNKNIRNILDDKGMANAIHKIDPLKASETYDKIIKRLKNAMDEINKDVVEYEAKKYW